MLGCPQDYQVGVFDRRGEVQYGDLEPSSLGWGRVLDDTSEATIVVPKAGDCCELLNRTYSWCSSVGIFRDGVRVWEGPVVGLRFTDDETVIRARDVTQWLFKRKIRALLDFTGPAAADLAAMAERLIRHALEPDDPNVLGYLHVLASGITGERKYDADSGYVLDAIAELGRTGLDWTALGRRIILSGETPLARLPVLDDEMFVGGVEVVEDGLAAVTDATVLGKGVRGGAGGVEVCGLLEALVTEEDILDQPSAQAEAEAIVAAGWPPPIYVEVPDGTQLSAETPVDINELVPGVVAPITSERTCRTVAADLRLIKVDVTYGRDAGERVAVTFAPVGVDTGRGL